MTADIVTAHGACREVTFSVERGEVFGLLGPNGAGKTTTLRMLAGLLAPDAGRARVAGCEIPAGRAGGPELRARVGLLTEAPGFYDRPTAIADLVDFIVARVLDQLDVPHTLGPRWGEGRLGEPLPGSRPA